MFWKKKTLPGSAFARALQLASLILQQPRRAGIRPAALVAALRRCPGVAPTLAGCHQKSRHRAPNSREAGGAAANRPVGSVFSRHSVASRMRAGRKPPEGDEAQPPGGGYPVSSPRELQPAKSTTTGSFDDTHRRSSSLNEHSARCSRGSALAAATHRGSPAYRRAPRAPSSRAGPDPLPPARRRRSSTFGERGYGRPPSPDV